MDSKAFEWYKALADFMEEGHDLGQWHRLFGALAGLLRGVNDLERCLKQFEALTAFMKEDNDLDRWQRRFEALDYSGYDENEYYESERGKCRFAKEVLEEQPSALNLAVLAQEGLSTIQKCNEMDPGSLTSKSLCLACINEEQEGVVGFLTRKKPELAREPQFIPETRDHLYPIQLAMDPVFGGGNISEEDTKALVDAWPESIVEPYHDDQIPVKLAIENGCSQELIDYMVDKPTKVDKLALLVPLGGPVSLGSSDLSWISKIIPKVHGELVCRRPWASDELLCSFLV